jgi:hypothetical protein
MELSKVRLDRESGDASLDLTIGIDTPEQYLDFDMVANGRDVRSVVRGTGSFEAFEQPFSISARGKLRGPHWTFDDLDAAIGDATVIAAGDLEFVDARAATEFEFALNIPSLASLGTIDGRRFQDQAFAVAAHVSGGDGQLPAEYSMCVSATATCTARCWCAKATSPKSTSTCIPTGWCSARFSRTLTRSRSRNPSSKTAA